MVFRNAFEDSFKNSVEKEGSNKLIGIDFEFL